MTARWFNIYVPYRAWLLVGFLIALVASFINPADRGDMVLEHVPTLVAVGFLIVVDHRRPLSNLSCTLLFIYMLMHVLGAHYLYSNVPYDDWSQRWLGIDITQSLGWKRNNYDRLVHFSHGLLLMPAMRELVERWMGVRGMKAIAIAVAFMAVLSMTYELAEWLIAVFLSPDAADKYNGQQGDVFDAQKDMGLAMAGALIAAVAMWPRAKRL